MRTQSLMQPAHTLGLARALALTVLLGSAACSQYDGTERWEGVYKPEAEIDRPKGVPMMAMDAGRPDSGADGAVADGATAGDAAPADAGTNGDAASSSDAASGDASNGDAMTGDAMTGDAAPADATPAG